MADTKDDDAPRTKGQGSSTNTGKQKKNVASWLQNLSADEKEARIQDLEKELEGLCGYYKEVKDQKVSVVVSECGSRNAVIAVLMEESEFPLSRLVDEIYDTLKKVEPTMTVTPASVKSCVLSVGQRVSYGVPNADADILEDHSENCFWCWETRDVNVIPKSVRGQFIVRRICRQRIRERIMAVSEMISSLKKPESEHNYNHGLIKASTKPCKTYSEADIRLLVDGLLQKNNVDMTLKKAKQEVKLILKQLDINKKEAEKGNKNMHDELQRETSLSENDLKLLQGEASKDEKCYKKEICKIRKQKKKQPEETEKDQRRREKKESELKEKRSLQNQVSFMERFLKRSKTSRSIQNDQFSTKSVACDLSISKSENVCESATLSMDCTLASSSDITLEDICKSHFSSWRCLGKSIRLKRKQGWGLRRKPKSELFKELKLAVNTGITHHDNLAMDKHVDGLGEHNCDVSSYPINADRSHPDAGKCYPMKQLLQFDNCHRPAFYGIWSKKSQVVGPRHPFRKEPSLDYDVDSDEEWEEEDPGESLTDCDKDEEECLEECSISDDESEDGFLVPEGYLSEDEVGTVIDVSGAESSPSCKDNVESEEFCALIRQQKNLNNLTEHALKKNQPLMIPNLMHDIKLGQNFSGTPKLVQMCLQSLSMLVIPGSSYIELSMDKMQDEVQEACLSTGKGEENIG